MEVMTPLIEDLGLHSEENSDEDCDPELAPVQRNYDLSTRQGIT